MQTTLASLLVPEVLHRVGQVHVPAIDLRSLQGLVEKPARRADEGTTLPVLLVTRLLTHEHESG